ncbi:recombinase family protein [Lacrimispora saccharolytica]|nr:recombinase family protein [Lacrimispora saccharolytica]
MEKRKVTTIPATINKFTAKPMDSKKKRRVAGYARVSTDHEDQQTSYEAQVDYYTTYIQGREDWEFAGLYSDEGISATNTKHRAGFNQMIADALAGKIDLIITKSVSRFARNTVDSLSTIRKLKEHNIECYFEKENIWTFDSKGELLLTIMSSLAQEESRSISENVTWGQRKRMADGKVSFAYSRFMGLDKDKETGKIVVNPEQAEVVKLIFRLFLEGLTPHAIAVELTSRGIKTPGGKDVWNQQTVRRMLSNEKYKGDALLQKEFTVDFLQKKMKKNEGEVPQYYVEGNHEAIISPAVFDMVQAELAKRKKGNSRYSGVTIFSNKIKCGDCGGWYGAKVWHSTDQYKKVIYRCNHKYKNEKCQTPHITENEVKTLFVKAYNELVSEKNEIIANAEIICQTLCTTESLLEEKQRLEDEILVLVEMTQNIVAENARVAQDQEEYQKRYDGLVQRYEATKKEYDELVERIEQKEARGERMRQFIKTLQKQEEIITEFDETLWGGMVDYVTIGKENRSVTFKDGTEITVE